MFRKTVAFLFASLLFMLLGACAGAPPAAAPVEPAAQAEPPAPLSVNALKEGQSCCAGGWVQCDCGAQPISRQVVYVDRPVEQCTQRVRVVEQRDACSDCTAFPVAMREKGACEK